MKKLQSNTIIFLAIFLIGSISISSCQKDPLNTSNSSPTVLEDSFFEQDKTLTHTNGKAVDYIINDLITLENALTINAGVVIEFAADAGIFVETGSINMQGTSSSRIVLTGKSKTNGYWRGLLFESNSSQNKMSFVDVNYAGSTTFNSNGDQASIIVWADTKLDILDCRITNGGANGISAIYSNTKLSISKTKITTCLEAPLVMNLSYLESLDGTNDFEGNTKDYIKLGIGLNFEITEDKTMYYENVPYRISPYNSFFNTVNISAGTLTIEAGTSILFEENTGVYITDNGALNAIGTTTNKISFEGVNKNKGAWIGIYFKATQNSSNMIKNTIIKHAGTTSYDGMNGGY